MKYNFIITTKISFVYGKKIRFHIPLCFDRDDFHISKNVFIQSSEVNSPCFQNRCRRCKRENARRKNTFKLRRNTTEQYSRNTSEQYLRNTSEQYLRNTSEQYLRNTSEQYLRNTSEQYLKEMIFHGLNKQTIFRLNGGNRFVESITFLSQFIGGQ